MKTVAGGSRFQKPRGRAWRVVVAVTVLAALAVPAMTYMSEKIYRYVAGTPGDMFISRTTAEPGTVLERLGYDLRVPGEDWYYRYDQSGPAQLVELRREVGDESDGGFSYSFSIMEWLADEETESTTPEQMFERDRDAALRRASGPAAVVTRIEQGSTGEVLVTEGTDRRSETFTSRVWVDHVPAVPCYAQHVRRSGEWMGKPVVTEDYVCTFSHPDSARPYVLTVSYSEAGAPSRQPTGDDFIDRVHSLLAQMTLRELRPSEIGLE